MHEKRIDIRWRDMDAYGHVNQAVYLTFAEETLDDLFRKQLGIAAGAIWDYVAVKTAIEYRSELQQTELQVVGTATIVRLGTKSITAKIELRAPDGRLAAELEAVVVAIDGPHGETRPLTDAERAALSEPASLRG